MKSRRLQGNPRRQGNFSGTKRLPIRTVQRRRRNTKPFLLNARAAQTLWGEISATARKSLRQLTEELNLSVSAGDLQFLDGKWYVTHSGLLRLSHRTHCQGIRSFLQNKLSDPAAGRWIFKAIVHTSAGSRGFVGYGDADPSNVSPLVRGAEMRVAETRAVNRALRKAYGIGLCSVEELGSFSSSSTSFPSRTDPSQNKSNGSCTSANHGSSNGQSRLRDRLCLLIRQYRLDASLVKSYAAEYCGTATLREASREMVEAFIAHLGEWASKDPGGLLVKLQSYAQPKHEEVRA